MDLEECDAKHLARVARSRGPRIRGASFFLYNWTDEDAERKTRFTKEELLQLKAALNLPDLLKTENNDQFSGVEGLCLLLCRLAFPQRYEDLVRIFRRDRSAIGRILGTMIDWIYTHWKRLLEWDPERLTRERLVMFARAIGASTGDEQGDVFGFVGGTSIEVCTTESDGGCKFGSKDQSCCLRYNLVVLPDGTVPHVSEPAAGRCSESAILALSCLPAKLDEYAWHSDGRPLKLFNDNAHAAGVHIERAPQRPAGVPPWINNHDEPSNDCIEMEQVIGDVNQFLGSSTWYGHNQALNDKVGQIFRLGILFSNCLTCLRGQNHVSEEFSHLYDDLPLIAPPTIQEYLNQNLFDGQLI